MGTGSSNSFFFFFLLEKPHGQQSLVGYSPKGYRESDTTE